MVALLDSRFVNGLVSKRWGYDPRLSDWVNVWFVCELLPAFEPYWMRSGPPAVSWEIGFAASPTQSACRPVLLWPQCGADQDVGPHTAETSDPLSCTAHTH